MGSPHPGPLPSEWEREEEEEEDGDGDGEGEGEGEGGREDPTAPKTASRGTRQIGGWSGIEEMMV